VPAKTPRPLREYSERKPAWGESRIASLVRLDDILLTYAVYKIEPGWACRAEPGSGVGDVPQPPALLLSQGLRPRCATRSVAAAVWRIVLRCSAPKACRNQGCGGVAILRASASPCEKTSLPLTMGTSDIAIA